MAKLHIGCGDTKKQGWINVDIRKTKATDHVLDVCNMDIFADNTFDAVFSHHSFEHFDFLPAVKELVRVSKHKAMWEVTVPYATSTKYNLINPYHKELFTEDKFRFFDDLYPREMPQDFKIKTKAVVFDYNDPYKWDCSPEENKVNRHKYFNVVNQMTLTLQVIK